MERNRGQEHPVRVFPELDYRFGTGPLRMTIEHVDWSNPVCYDNENWYEIIGVEQTTDGRAIGRRRALVKGSQLRELSGGRPSPPGKGR